MTTFDKEYREAVEELKRSAKSTIYELRSIIGTIETSIERHSTQEELGCDEDEAAAMLETASVKESAWEVLLSMMDSELKA